MYITQYLFEQIATLQTELVFGLSGRIVTLVLIAPYKIINILLQNEFCCRPTEFS